MDCAARDGAAAWAAMETCSSLLICLAAGLAGIEPLPGAESPGVFCGLDLHLDDVRPGVERCLDRLEGGLEHLRAPAGQQRAAGPRLVRQARRARRRLGRLDLRPRGLAPLRRRYDGQLGADGRTVV